MIINNNIYLRERILFLILWNISKMNAKQENTKYIYIIKEKRINQFLILIFICQCVFSWCYLCFDKSLFYCSFIHKKCFKIFSNISFLAKEKIIHQNMFWSMHEKIIYHLWIINFNMIKIIYCNFAQNEHIENNNCFNHFNSINISW